MSREGDNAPPALGRPHPFELVFAGCRDKQFPAIRRELDERSDLDSFMLAASALELMRELRPDEGLGDAVHNLVALVHAAYLFWRAGECTVAFGEPATRLLCRSPDGLAAGSDRHDLAPQSARYIQIVPRIVWGQIADDAPFEPLDGWFVAPASSGLGVVACFGVHSERPGVSVVAVDGPPPALMRRADGTRLYAPTMPGGDAAHLHAVGAPGELLLLAWRATAGEEVP